MDEPTDGVTRSGLRAGSRFGHYRLRRVLGSGGFGQVWEAEDTVMDRVVALKLLRSEYSENEKFRQRLFREARAAGRLHEPHVVPIHHCGEIAGQLYIDMRLVDGTDLETVLAQEGSLSPARTVAVVRQIAAALDAAHAAQMIHRDVKPANILLTEDDFACLLDFGLANAATDAKLTSTGFTIGTFAYMAPERFSDAEVDHRADIYALACVLYECLTGFPAYTRADAVAMMGAHVNDPIPAPSQHVAGISAAFDEVISRGMAKNAENRYASPGELARAARRALIAPDQGHADGTPASTQATTGPTAGPPKAGPPKAGPPKASPPNASPAKGSPPKASPPKASPAKGSPPKASPPKASPDQVHAGTNAASTQAAAAKRVPPQAETSGRPWWSRQWKFIVVTLVALLVLAGLAIVLTVIRSNYYVAEYNGMVSIVRGIQGSLLGMSLHEPYLVGCLNARNELSLISYSQSGSHLNCDLMRLQDLRPAERAQVQAGLPGGTLDDAIGQLRELSANSLLPACPQPRATSPPTTTPPTVTELPPPSPVPGIDCRAAA